MVAAKQKQILIAGATGLIGQELVSALLAAGYKIVVLTHSSLRDAPWANHPSVSSIEWTGIFTNWLVREVEKSYAVINLAGQNIAAKPWTRRRRMQLIRSRLGTTRALAKACHYAQKQPNVFVQASATGFYSTKTKDTQNESTKKGEGFLARLTADWESVAQHELPSSIRLVLIRTGVVLSNKGGMLPKLTLPIKLMIGGWFGNGKQYVPWIHIHDEVNAIIHLMHTESASGPFNIVSPQAISQKELVKAVAKKLKRAAWIPIPAPAIKLLLGQMGYELLLSGSLVDSSKLVQTGYNFKYPTLSKALDNLF
ncbi:TIGR01777 family oxidoreductase [Perlabentimonas gracilis]|uniref:TIGR01777 family oxidoreductase n=1 Tax=Perlabentimonas gracilis TaxID=2715279 RepID=UPI00140BFF8E|nr:TIGR01777 family oxidoreductase [Perlabentimonas gracilis]NHB68364.1 TIGR01777 family protein [Perlabentimonas gracilis]